MSVRAAPALAVVALCAASTPAFALEARVTQLRVTGSRLWATVELRDLLRDVFLNLVREGRAVFVQLEADLWEDHRIFDRVVLAAPPATYRVDRDASGRGIVLLDQYGGSSPHPDPRQPVSLRVEIGAADRVDDGQTYYLHVLATAATVDEREIDNAGEAIFGEERSARGLASLGRFVFRTLLRMGRYFESAQAQVTSRRLSGRDIRAGAF